MEAFVAVAYVSGAAATVPYFTVMGMCAVVIGAVLYVPVYVLHAAELEESRRRPRRSSSPPPLRFGSSSSISMSRGLSHTHCQSLKDTASTGIGSSTASYRSNSELSPILKSHSNDFLSDNHDGLTLSNIPSTVMESQQYWNEVVQNRRRSGSSAPSSSSLYLYSPRRKPQPPQLISRTRQESKSSFCHDCSDQKSHLSDGKDYVRRNRFEDESDAANDDLTTLSEDVIAALQRGDGPFFFQL